MASPARTLIPLAVIAVMSCACSAFNVASPALFRCGIPNTRAYSRHLGDLHMSMERTPSGISRRAAVSVATGFVVATVLPSTGSAAGATAIMTIKTQDGIQGQVEIELFEDIAPKTVAAFKTYASEGLYDGTAFHRVNKFMKKKVLIGGDPNTKEEPYCNTIRGTQVCSDGLGYGPDGFLNWAKRTSSDDSQKTKQMWDKGGPKGWRTDGLSEVKLEPEFVGKHERGVITMRRFRNPESAGSQFMICLADMSKELDGQSAAFGKITKGIELLDKIDVDNVVKSESALEFYRDDSKQNIIWSAWDRPVYRQGIERITVQ